MPRYASGTRRRWKTLQSGGRAQRFTWLGPASEKGEQNGLSSSYVFRTASTEKIQPIRSTSYLWARWDFVAFGGWSEKTEVFVLVAISTQTEHMASSRSWVNLALVVFVALSLGILLPAAQAQAPAPAPAPTSDGTSIDQGVAYTLMLVALAVTYLIHAADASSKWGLF
ncbi:hypothetical protein B296_00029183 [Ensete ventricosum]|uniref:Arabinogalactan peptide 16 n=2 Tax=Ensete ventricosum TaxID=4639 RepID=A0A426ZR06_ENSVE|nr:hypothetical protein B296_00029183 [Ensete ventricosum]